MEEQCDRVGGLVLKRLVLNLVIILLFLSMVTSYLCPLSTLLVGYTAGNRYLGWHCLQAEFWKVKLNSFPAQVWSCGVQQTLRHWPSAPPSRSFRWSWYSPQQPPGPWPTSLRCGCVHRVSDFSVPLVANKWFNTKWRLLCVFMGLPYPLENYLCSTTMVRE